MWPCPIDHLLDSASTHHGKTTKPNLAVFQTLPILLVPKVTSLRQFYGLPQVRQSNCLVSVPCTVIVPLLCLSREIHTSYKMEVH
jgi:hypothetical protein